MVWTDTITMTCTDVYHAHGTIITSHAILPECNVMVPMALSGSGARFWRVWESNFASLSMRGQVILWHIIITTCWVPAAAARSNQRRWT